MEVMGRIYINCFMTLVFLVSLCCAPCIASDVVISPPIFIAHAGGEINHETYTNSLEALNLNYGKNFRFFELDFAWTSDEELVSIHDWDGSFQGIFYVSENTKIPTKAQFLNLKTRTGLTQLSLEDVLRWAERKGDTFIITDVKNENIKALRKICSDYKKYKKYIIPQVYSYQEYDEAVKLGYSNIILTLYRMDTTFDDLMNFQRRHAPFAITMPIDIAQSGIVRHLKQNNVRVYAHTVNELDIFNSLRKLGVFGIYTDNISPP